MANDLLHNQFFCQRRSTVININTSLLAGLNITWKVYGLIWGQPTHPPTMDCRVRGVLHGHCTCMADVGVLLYWAAVLDKKRLHGWCQQSFFISWRISCIFWVIEAEDSAKKDHCSYRWRTVNDHSIGHLYRLLTTFQHRYKPKFSPPSESRQFHGHT